LAGNTVVTANFNRPVLTAQLIGNGLVSSNPVGINSCVAICSAPFDKGSLVALTAAGVGFAGWSGGGCVGVGTCLVTMDQDSTVTATFQAVGLPPFAQQAYLKGTNNAVNQRFGRSVALDGDTLVVGATGDASCVTGINGDQANTNNSCPSAGAVYVFMRTGGVWSQQAYLKASNTDSFDEFGWSVALSGDTVVVGARAEDSNATGVNGDQASNSAFNSGAAYVFTRTGGVWSQQAYLKASNTDVEDQFGWSLALYGDTLVVGTPWEDSNTTGVTGDQANNSAPDSGAAYVFTRTGGLWSQQAYLKASTTDTEDQFGRSVALSGDTVVVGAEHEGSCATGINGDQANNACAASGAAYVFTRTGGLWSQQAYLKSSNTDIRDRFGSSIALSNDTLVVGAMDEQSCVTGINGGQANNSCVSAGAAYVFMRTGGVWSQEAYLKASNTDAGDFFGSSIALSGDRVVVGAVVEDSCTTGINGDQANNACAASGAAYVFTRIGGIWSQLAYLKASNTGTGDQFGWSVTLSGDTVVVGAIEEDSNATGVNGDQADNSTSGSGAAYVFVVQ
jgi:hypothetical protein